MTSTPLLRVAKCEGKTRKGLPCRAYADRLVNDVPYCQPHAAQGAQR